MKTSFLLVLIISSVLIVSCQSYYTAEDFYKVPKIDAHIHYSYANPVLMEQAQKDNFRLITVNVETQTNPHIDVQETVAIELMTDHQANLAFLSTFGSDDWDSVGWAEGAITRIDKSAEKGASGVKIWKTFGMQIVDTDSNFVFIDHEQLSPVFNHMENREIPLLAHIGEPKNCWLPLDEMTTANDRNYFSSHPEFHMYLHPEMPSYEKIMETRDRVLAKHSGLKVVGAHFGSVEWDLDSLAMRFDKYPNFAVDMAARIGHMHFQSDKDYGKTRNFFIKYRLRILYGTDIGVRSEAIKSGDRFHDEWYSDWIYLATDQEFHSDLINKKVKGLKLPKEVIDDIYFNNSTKWYPGVGFLR